MNHRLETVAIASSKISSTQSHALDCLLQPQSIAIVGASPKPNSFGHHLYQSVCSLGYAGQVYLINPKYSEISGQAAYKSLADLPQAPDCVAMAIADAHLAQHLELAGQAGAKSAVMFGRAYGHHTNGREHTDNIAAIAKEYGMQLCGANCMGFVNVEAKLQMTGFPFKSLDQSGSIGVISHSGSTWSGIVGNLRHMRFNTAISAGQELATGVAQYMDYLIAQTSTRVIALVLETVRQPELFLQALDKAHAAGIAVVALKLGRSEKGQYFAKSHSGAMSGSADVFDAVFKRHGVISVSTLDELMDTAELLAASRRPTQSAIALGCDSGGERQLIVDIAEEVDLEFAVLRTETQDQLKNFLSPGIEAINPLDYWGDGEDHMADCLLTMAKDPGVGTVVMATNMAEGQDFMYDCCRALEKTWLSTHKPVVLMGNVSTTMSPKECNRLRDLGIPVLMGTATALSALSHYSQFIQRQLSSSIQTNGVNHNQLLASSFTSSHEQKVLHSDSSQDNINTPYNISPEKLQHWQQQLQAAAHQNLSLQNFELLKDFSIPTAASLCTAEWSEALAFAHQVSYPLVAKIDAADVAHKSELGGVILNIRQDSELEAAWQQLQSKVPGAVLLQSQLSGVELILGMKKDPTFGPVFTVGMGGIFVEIMKDLALLLPNDNKETIAQAILSLKGAALLQGARGQAVVDLAQLVQIVQDFIHMGMCLVQDVNEMEINPLLVSASKMAAVDFLVLPAPIKTEGST